jgi:hypothetical protein
MAYCGTDSTTTCCSLSDVTELHLLSRDTLIYVQESVYGNLSIPGPAGDKRLRRFKI